MNKIFKQYSIKWDIPEDSVQWVYLTLQQNGRRYGKTSKVLRGFGTSISPRQLRYFIGKVRLDERLNVNIKGKPQNYRELSRQEL